MEDLHEILSLKRRRQYEDACKCFHQSTISLQSRATVSGRRTKQQEQRCQSPDLFESDDETSVSESSQHNGYSVDWKLVKPLNYFSHHFTRTKELLERDQSGLKLGD